MGTGAKLVAYDTGTLVVTAAAGTAAGPLCMVLASPFLPPCWEGRCQGLNFLISRVLEMKTTSQAVWSSQSFPMKCQLVPT